MDGSLVFLFAALGIVWIVIVGYIVLLSNRLSTLRREIERQEEEMKMHRYVALVLLPMLVGCREMPFSEPHTLERCDDSTEDEASGKPVE